MICEQKETYLKDHKITIRTRMIRNPNSINFEFIQSASHMGGYVLDVKIFELWEPKIEEFHQFFVDSILDKFKLTASET